MDKSIPNNPAQPGPEAAPGQAPDISSRSHPYGPGLGEIIRLAPLSEAGRDEVRREVGLIDTVRNHVKHSTEGGKRPHSDTLSIDPFYG